MSVKQLKELVWSMPCDILVDFVECMWIRGECQLLWNTDNNLIDLEAGDGNTYSVEYYIDGVEYDGYFVVNIDDGCGGKCTTFFNLDMEVKEESQ